MRLAPFRLHRPDTIEAATGLLDELGPDGLVYCGGTELLLVAKLGLTDFTDLVDVKRIDELAGIDGVEGELRIGATTTHRQLERSPLVRERWPTLAAMERGVGNLRVRNVGTIGGNLSFADPHSDPATYLIAAGGSVTLRRGGGPARRISIEDFTRGPYDTALEPGELLVSVHCPSRRPARRSCTARCPSTSAPRSPSRRASAVRDGAVARSRIAVGSVGVTPVRARLAEAILDGADAEGDGVIEVCAETAAAEVEPVADANGSVEYKRALVGVLVSRCVAEALSSARR